MLTKRHTSTKAGQKRDRGKWLFRKFRILARALIGITSKTPRSKLRQNLHNADYHLSPAHMARIVEAASSQRDWVILELLTQTGMRRSEIAAIGIEDIRWQESLILVRHGKGNKMRLVPITSDLIANIKALICQRETGPVFLSQKDRAISPRQVNRIVSEAGRMAGITNPNPKYNQVTPHLLRHSFARLWKDKGGDIEALSSIMGHASIKTTWDLYGKMSFTDVKREYHRLIELKKTKAIINAKCDDKKKGANNIE